MDSNGNVDNSSVMDLTKNIMIMSLIALFCFIVFAFFVYFFSNRRRQQVMQVTNDPVFEQQRGLDASFLKTIRVIVFNPKDFKEGLECAVCLADLEEGEEARILPKCDHAFHVECIDMWFHSHSTCPVCRNPLIPDQVEIIVEQEEAMNVALEEDEEDNNPHGSGSEEASSSSSSSSSSLQTDKNRERPDLAIDIPPREGNEQEDDEKTPGSFSRSMRSLKRILSGNSRFSPFSPRS